MTGTVRGIAHLQDLESGVAQGRGEVYLAAEPQGRVGGDDGSVGREDVSPPEADELAVDFGDLAPRLDDLRLRSRAP